jgi:molecular chaperone GrpE
MVEKEHKKSAKAATPAEEPIEEAAPVIDFQAQVDDLKQQLEKSEAQSTEYFDGWQRERADFINYKKRVDRDLAQNQMNAVGNVAKKFLVVMDDMERALKNRPQSEDGATWAAGIELIYHKMQGILEADGIKQMQIEGDLFDPTRHEALTNEESPAHQSGQIIEVIQNGYVIGDKVLRHALVRVAR